LADCPKKRAAQDDGSVAEVVFWTLFNKESPSVVAAGMGLAVAPKQRGTSVEFPTKAPEGELSAVEAQRVAKKKELMRKKADSERTAMKGAVPKKRENQLAYTLKM